MLPPLLSPCPAPVRLRLRLLPAPVLRGVSGRRPSICLFVRPSAPPCVPRAIPTGCSVPVGTQSCVGIPQPSRATAAVCSGLASHRAPRSLVGCWAGGLLGFNGRWLTGSILSISSQAGFPTESLGTHLEEELCGHLGQNHPCASPSPGGRLCLAFPGRGPSPSSPSISPNTACPEPLMSVSFFPLGWDVESLVGWDTWTPVG